jgi:hypothetical protein
MLALAILWAVLASAVIVLAAYRKMAARSEDDAIHVQEAVIGKQTALARTLDTIDHWGKILTLVVAVYGLGLLAYYLYSSWEQSSQLVK